MTKGLSFAGVGLLAFLASALVILGLVLSFVTHDSVDPRDASVPWEGFLMATLGIEVAVATCRIAARLGAAKPVEDVLGLVFSFFGILGFLSLIVSLWEQPKSPSGLPPGAVIWFALALLETLAALLWLLAEPKRERKAGARAS